MTAPGTDSREGRTSPTGSPRLHVRYIQRKPGAIHFSIERVFDMVRRALPEDITGTTWICRFESRGLLPRLLNLVEAAFQQGDVTHVTGDIHYVTLSLRPSRTVL